MKRVVQSRTGSDGTCFRACLASILDLRENQVPDFTDEGFFEQADKFLLQYGLKYRRTPLSSKPSGYSTIEGISPRGGLHACVALDGELVWDPHPIEDGTGQGLVEPRYYGVLEPVGRGRDGVGHWDEPDTKKLRSVGGFCKVCKDPLWAHNAHEVEECLKKLGSAKDRIRVVFRDIKAALQGWESDNTQKLKQRITNIENLSRNLSGPEQSKVMDLLEPLYEVLNAVKPVGDAIIKKVGPETCVDCKKKFMVHPFWLKTSKEKYGVFVCFDCRGERPDESPKSFGLSWSEMSGKKPVGDADVFMLIEILSVLGLSEGEWQSLSESQQKKLRENAYKELRRRKNPSRMKHKLPKPV